jgi:hypothetical protein
MPHISATAETRDAMSSGADNLDAYFAGREPRDASPDIRQEAGESSGAPRSSSAPQPHAEEPYHRLANASMSEDGFASDWHLVHLGSRAVGGAGLVFTDHGQEARGRISPQDLGLWKDAHIDMLRRIVAFVHGQAP